MKGKGSVGGRCLVYPGCESWLRELVGTDGVADRCAQADQVVGMEFGVVLDVIVANLRTDKNVAPNVIADAATKVFHEMIAAGVVNAAGDITRGWEIESSAGDADSGHQVEAKFLAQTRLEKGVDVGQDGAVLLIAVVVCLSRPKRCFGAKAKAPVPEANEVAADVDVAAALLCRLLEVKPSDCGR